MPGRLAGHERQHEEHDCGGARLQSPSAQPAAWNDLVDLHDVDAPGRVFEKRLAEEPRRWRSLGGDDIDGRGEAIVETGHALLDEARQLQIGRLVAQGHDTPDKGRGDEDEDDTSQRRERQGRSNAERRDRPDHQCHGDEGRHRERGTDRGIEDRQRPIPRTDAVQETLNRARTDRP